MSFQSVLRGYEAGLSTVGFVAGGWLLLTATFLADVLR